MATYKMNLDGDVLYVGFGEDQADNDKIVVDVLDILKSIEISGGEILKINGRLSIPVAFVIAHAVNHLYKAIAIYDPKVGYIITVSHSNKYKVGDIIVEDSI